MGKGIFRKVGWTWTRQGWKPIPRRLLGVKLVPMPKKRKVRKLRRVSPACPKAEKLIRAEPQNLPAESEELSAPNPAVRGRPRPQRPTDRYGIARGQIWTPIHNASGKWRARRTRSVHVVRGKQKDSASRS
jgi:hypothetical protein